MKYPKLGKAYDHRGSSMGRVESINDPNAEIKFRLYKMPMSSCGAYDNGGAYWGCGSHQTGWMYHAYGDGPEWGNEVFIRATSRKDAKSKVVQQFKNAKFYR